MTQQDALSMIISVMVVRSPEHTASLSRRRAQIMADPEAFRVAVVQLVLDGTMSTDNGERLREIIDQIVAEASA